MLVREDFELCGLAKGPRGLGRIVIKRIVAKSPSRGVAANGLTFHQLINQDCSFSCRSDCTFEPVDLAVVASSPTSLECCCCLLRLTEKEQSSSIVGVSSVAALLTLVVALLAAIQGPFPRPNAAAASAACKEEDYRFTVLRGASSSVFDPSRSFDAKVRVAA